MLVANAGTNTCVAGAMLNLKCCHCGRLAFKASSLFWQPNIYWRTVSFNSMVQLLEPLEKMCTSFLSKTLSISNNIIFIIALLKQQKGYAIIITTQVYGQLCYKPTQLLTPVICLNPRVQRLDHVQHDHDFTLICCKFSMCDQTSKHHGTVFLWINDCAFLKSTSKSKS